ncbi:MAG TPA: ATP-binding protein [Solirubrobacterales bacterium]|jgi:anti-sigma regulatory factor (Ser/Thr protein kinase)
MQSTQGDAHLHISLPAQPDSLPLVRRAVAAHAEKLGVARARIADLKTVVSEACANVIRHAYGEGGQGMLEVDLTPSDRELNMVVRDFGGGIRPVPSEEVPSLRLGLPIIGALSSSFELVSVLSRGTEITVRFDLATAG